MFLLDAKQSTLLWVGVEVVGPKIKPQLPEFLPDKV